MASQGEIAISLDRLEAAGFVMGAAWAKAHEVAQTHEGEAAFDRLHALLHRIEGDDRNASYWYRRAGRAAFAGSFAEEAMQLRSAIA